MGRQMRRIAVLTSGGDAAGMNAAVRAAVRVGLDQGCETFGVRQGYSGLMTGDFVSLGARSVGGIIQQGGTILGSTRCDEFRTDAGRRRALECLERQEIDGLVVIGGNGSQRGAHLLSELGFPVVGVASTIDNDLAGSDITLGVDTALNVALEAIDRLKTTASSHHRAFVVEVMGRDCGYLALMAGIAGGAEAIAIPEVETTPAVVAAEVRAAYERGKAHAIIVVSEHATCNAPLLERYFAENGKDLGFELRVTKLGHVQRGGAPGAFDRLLGTRLGAAAVQSLVAGKYGLLTGLVGGGVVSTPLADVVGQTKELDPWMLDVARALAA
jgi:6-phosphofructokinase 1